MTTQPDLDVLIGKKIQQLRESKKISRLELAKVLGYESDTAVYLIESGKRGLSPEKLKAVADYLKISVDVLMGTKAPDNIHLRTALRSDKKLTEQDMDQVEKFVEFLKNYPQNK